MSETDMRAGERLKQCIRLSVQALRVEAYSMIGVNGHVCANLMPCRWHKTAAFGNSSGRLAPRDVERKGCDSHPVPPFSTLIWGCCVTVSAFLHRDLHMPGIPGQGIFFRRGRAVTLPECPTWRWVTVSVTECRAKTF